MKRVALPTQLAVFSALFAAGMWMSKVAHPLYFEDEGAMTAFGVGYAVMAVAGGFSFLWGSIADRLGGLIAARIGIVLYAVGLAGRLWTDIVPVVVFSAIAGIGASTVLVAIRPWVRSLASDADIPRIVAARNVGNHIGVFAGTVGAAALMAAPAPAGRGPALALLAAPAIALLGFAWLALGDSRPAPAKPSAEDGATTPSRTWSITLRLVVIGVVSGCYVSLLTPYAPLILTEAGGTAAQASLVIALTSAAQLAVSSLLTRFPLATGAPLRVFTVSELATGLLTLTLVRLLGGSFWLVVIVYVARAALVSLAVITEETIQYAVIPARSVGFAFGASQAAFLAGDALGGIAGAQLWQQGGATPLLAVAGAMTLLNAALLPLLLGSRWRDCQKENEVAPVA